MHKNDSEKLYRVDEAADILGLKGNTIRKWILTRRIGYAKVGSGAVRIPASELTRLVSFVPAREVRLERTENSSGL